MDKQTHSVRNFILVLANTFQEKPFFFLSLNEIFSWADQVFHNELFTLSAWVRIFYDEKAWLLKQVKIMLFMFISFLQNVE